jgi:hypothetical protein
MDDKMPCGAAVGVFCICHTTTNVPNADITVGLPAAKPWQPSKRRRVVVDLSVSTDGPA